MINKQHKAYHNRTKANRGLGGKPNKVLIFFVRIYLWFWFLRYPLRYEWQQSRPEGPCVLIANHPSSLDAFLLGYGFNAHITNFVGSQHFFRKPVTRFLLTLVGAIPKLLSKNDLFAMRLMKKCLDAGRILMIFPEGRRSMDGTGSRFSDAIAKFIKRCDVSVFAAHIEGSYLAWPRWSDKPAIGPLAVTFMPVMTQEDTRNLSVEEIHHRLLEATKFDEFAAAKKFNREYRTKTRTDGIERLLHICPDCKKLESIVGRGDLISCVHCGAQAHMAANGEIQRRSGLSTPWPNVPDWYQFQRSELAVFVADDNFSMDLGECILETAKFAFDTFDQVAIGILTISRSGLLFVGTASQQNTRSSTDESTIRMQFPIALIETTAASLGKHIQLCDEDKTHWQLKFTGCSKVILIEQIAEIIFT